MPANDTLSMYLYNGIGTKVLKTAELRVPFTLNRVTLTPADTGTTETQTLQPYYNGFAKVNLNKKVIKDGQNADNELIHQFVIRLDPNLAIEASDFVVVDRQFFKVQSIAVSKMYKNAFEINTVEHQPFEQRDPNINLDLANEDKPVDTIKQGDFDTWVA